MYNDNYSSSFVKTKLKNLDFLDDCGQRNL